jgi:iron uptake system component EfeO
MIRSRVSPPLAALLALSCAVSCSDDDSPSPSPKQDASIDGGHADAGIDGSSALLDAALDAALSDQEQQASIVDRLHDALLADLNNLKKAAQDLQAAAPTGHAWDATQDAAAIAAMREAWGRARTAYEHIEGALAPLFPDLDGAIDARYDDFLATLGESGDAYAFDDQGVTGLHAQERILWAYETRKSVIDFEASLPGYRAAAFPANAQEAADFKAKLSQKVIDDAQRFIDQWQPANIDLQEAFRGLISLMNEQHEKVTKASSNEEESRYSQTTMKDIRENLEGTKSAYMLFAPWLRSKTASTVHDDAGVTANGVQTDDAIEAGFSALSALYAQTAGDAFPPVPDSWSAENPSASDLQTPFGKLYSGVLAATNTEALPSVVLSMNHAAALLGFPEFEEEE